MRLMILRQRMIEASHKLHLQGRGEYSDIVQDRWDEWAQRTFVLDFDWWQHTTVSIPNPRPFFHGTTNG